MPGSPPRTTRASTAQGDYVVLFNSDAALFDDALSPRRLARCAPGRRRVEPEIDRGRRCAATVCLSVSACLRRLSRALRLSPRQPEGEGWIAGTALVIRRAALAAIGGRLDDGFWMYWKDCDLSRAMAPAGWRVSAFEGSTIRHHGGASGGGLDSNRRRSACVVRSPPASLVRETPAAFRSGGVVVAGRRGRRPQVGGRGTLHPSRRGERVRPRRGAARALRPPLRPRPEVPGGGRRS